MAERGIIVSSQASTTTLNGSLSGTTLADLCQIMGQRTGVLELHQTNRLARVYFNQGALVHAELGDLFGKDAFLDAAGWRDGSFQFLNGALPSYVSIQEKATALIMEAAVYHDVWAQLHASAIYEETFLLGAEISEEQAGTLFEEPVHIEIWNRLGAPITVAQLVRELGPHGYTKADVVHGVWRMVQAGALRPAARPGPMETPAGKKSTPAMVTPEGVGSSSHHRTGGVPGWLLPAAIGVLLLGLAGWWLSGIDSEAEQIAETPETVERSGALEALNTEALLALEGEEVVVRGRVVRTNTDPGSGITFLDFRSRPRQGFVMIIYPDDLGAWEGKGAPLDLYRDQEVEVRGTVTVYQRLPQIVLRAPEQISVVGA